MSELLTTGQMVDKLKVGEEARCIETRVEDWLGSTVKAQQHFWNWTLTSGKSEEFYVSKAVQNCKWVIEPIFVSFEEAVKALKDGKEVRSYIDGHWYDTYNNKHTEKSMDINEILNAEWVIVD